MNTISVKHYDSKNKQIGSAFNANLNKYMAVNKGNDFINWDDVMTAFYNSKSYKTVNMPYGNIELALIEGE